MSLGGEFETSDSVNSDDLRAGIGARDRRRFVASSLHGESQFPEGSGTAAAHRIRRNPKAVPKDHGDPADEENSCRGRRRQRLSAANCVTGFSDRGNRVPLAVEPLAGRPS